jgi:hypothetical protein
MASSSRVERISRSVVVGLVAGLCCAAAAVIAAGERAQADFSRAALDRRAPVVAERSYTLKAGVRLLVFWIRRDNVGSARLTWRAGQEGHRLLEFLVGSDPERAPRRINRWGYIVEEARPPDVDLLGIMSKSDEESADEAESQIAAEGQRDSHPYNAIRTTIRGGSASSGVFRVSSAKALTYRDLETLLGMIPDDVPASRAVSLPKGTRPGFLFAAEELIASTLDRCRSGVDAEPASLPYLYNNTFYTLTLQECDFESTRKIGNRVFSNVIRAKLETRNRATGNTTSFRLEYGTEGDLKAVPLRMVFRPKWWFEAELLLDDQRLGRPGASRP